MRRWAAFLALAAGCGDGTDLDGRPVLPAPLIVYAFAQPGCPLAERGAPEILRLRDAYPGASFRVVYPGRRFSPDALRAHRDAFFPGLPALHDPELRLARSLGVRVTPEAAVVTPRGLAYRGRIDDRYADLDVRRLAPTRRDLEEALGSLARGERPSPAATEAVGCPLVE